MRQMVVPQSGHLPLVMGLPFFVVLSTGSFIIFLALHFTQYASIAMSNLYSLVSWSRVAPLLHFRRPGALRLDVGNYTYTFF